jgi:hypothetical protein
MNAKQVPEKVPSSEEQMRFLLEKLAGHQAFGRLRGRMMFSEKGDSGTMPQFKLTTWLPLGEMLQASDSPTGFCRMIDEQYADIRVIGNLLAQLRRDGWKHAETELSRALGDDAYFMDGESVPVEKLEPVTLLVLDFPRTLAMIKWIVTCDWWELNNVLFDKPVRDLTTELFRQFPTLLEHTKSRNVRMMYEGCDLLAAYKDAVISRFRKAMEGFEGLGMASLVIHHGTYNRHLEIDRNDGGDVFGFIIRAEQQDVLKRFSRDEQKHISTWLCHAPKLWMEGFSIKPHYTWHRFDVGFHPEAEHGSWMNRAGAFTSAGFSCGYGAVLLNERWPTGFKPTILKWHEGEPFRFVLNNF